MKLGFLYDAVYPWIKGGGEKTLYELAISLRDRGHECHLFGMHLWDGPRDIERDGLHYHALCPNLPLYGPDGKRRASQPLRFAWGVLTRLPRYDLKSFDLFDVHAFPFLSVPPFQLVRLLRAHRVPWLLTWLEVWGPDYWRRYLGRKGMLGSLVERWCARTAPHHLCISPNTARRLAELLRVDPARITTIPRGFLPPAAGVLKSAGAASAEASLPAEAAQAAEAAPAAGAQPSAGAAQKVVVAGRLLAYKRVDLAVRAWPEVVRRLPGAELHIVGDGPERAALEVLAGDLGVTANVMFRGQLPEREQVLDEIASAALLLQPSEREGQSTVVLEALTLGTPVLAATGDETAVGDFLGAGPHAELARLDDGATPAEWADRIVRLLESESARRALVENGRKQVSELGWAGHIAPQVEALYQRLVK